MIAPFLIRIFFKVPLLMEMPTDYTNYVRMVQMTEKQNLIAKIINISWFKFYKRVILRRINFMRPLNKLMVDDLVNMNYPRERMIKLANGIKSKKLIGLKKNPHPGVHYGFVGRLTKIKNLNFLLEVIKMYFNEYPNDKLFIYGEGPEKNSLLDFIYKNNMSENVFLVGFENDQEKIYTNIDVLLNTSFGEGIPNVILEAMATKTFIIASNVHGNNDLINHNETGFLFRHNNKNDFLKQLLRYRQNKVDIDNILENANIEIVKNYDIQVIAHKLFAFFNSHL
ncbi:MAG: glycosyltransferase family 4 protein [Promethearchaeota archaeon]